MLKRFTSALSTTQTLRTIFNNTLYQNIIIPAHFNKNTTRCFSLQSRRNDKDQLYDDKNIPFVDDNSFEFPSSKEFNFVENFDFPKQELDEFIFQDEEPAHPTPIFDSESSYNEYNPKLFHEKTRLHREAKKVANINRVTNKQTPTGTAHKRFRKSDHKSSEEHNMTQEENISEHEQSLYQREALVEYAQTLNDELLRSFYVNMDRQARSKLSLSDLKGHLNAFATDRFGSAFISNCLQRRKRWVNENSDEAREILKQEGMTESPAKGTETGFWYIEHDFNPNETDQVRAKRFVMGFTTTEVDFVFEELYPFFNELVSHVYGKFVLYHLALICSPAQRQQIFKSCIHGKLEELASTKGGSMISERLFELMAKDEAHNTADEFVSEVKGHVGKYLQDSYSHYILDAIVRSGTISQKRAILDELLEGQVSVMQLIKTHQPSKVMEKFVRFPETRTLLLKNIGKNDYLELANDTYGSFFVIQCLKHGTSTQRKFIFDALLGKILLLALNSSASRVINQLFQVSTKKDIELILEEVKGHFLIMSQDRYANYFMKQILCETNNVNYLDMVVKELSGSLVLLSYQRYSSKVVEYILNLIIYYTKKGVELPFSVDEFLQEFTRNTVQMAKDKYATYTVQQVLHIALGPVTSHLVTKETKLNLMREVLHQAMNLALDQYGCFLIQFLVRNRDTRMGMMRRFLETDHSPKEFNSNNFFQLINNRNGVTVLLELVKQCDTNQRNALFTVMKSYRPRITESHFGRVLLHQVKEFDEMGILSVDSGSETTNMFSP